MYNPCREYLKKQIDIIVIIINNNYLCTQEIENKMTTNNIH